MTINMKISDMHLLVFVLLFTLTNQLDNVTFNHTSDLQSLPLENKNVDVSGINLTTTSSEPKRYEKNAQLINRRFVKKVISKGSNVVLNCTFTLPTDDQVTWSINNETLAVNGLRYRGDKRIHPLHQKGSRDYSLLLNNVTESDSGYYVCHHHHKSTQDSRQKITIKLLVIEAYSAIFGPSSITIASGKTLYLFCLVLEVHDIPDYILWYHNELVIEYQRPTVEVIMAIETRSSELRIHNTTFNDAGVYMCKPSNADPSYVTVIVHHAVTVTESKKTDFTKWMLLIQMLATFCFFFSSYVIAYVIESRRNGSKSNYKYEPYPYVRPVYQRRSGRRHFS